MILTDNLNLNNDMNNYFFPERRQVNNFSLNEKKGKVKIDVTVYEQWDNISMRNISCGEKYIKRFERKIGIKKEVKEELESSIKSSIGINGLAKLEGQIKNKISSSFSFDHWIHESEERELTAPKCGKRIIEIWQKLRIYYVEIIDTRVFSSFKGCNKQIFSEYLDFFHDNAKVFSYDPSCGCGGKEFTPEDGIFEILIGNKVLMLSPYRKLENGNILIENLDIELNIQDLGQMMLGEYKIDYEVIPSYLSFLGDLENCQCNITLRNHNSFTDNFNDSIEKLQDRVTIIMEHLRTASNIPYDLPFVIKPFGSTQLEEDDDLSRRQGIWWQIPPERRKK